MIKIDREKLAAHDGYYAPKTRNRHVLKDPGHSRRHCTGWPPQQIVKVVNHRDGQKTIVMADRSAVFVWTVKGTLWVEIPCGVTLAVWSQDAYRAQGFYPVQ